MVFSTDWAGPTRAPDLTLMGEGVGGVGPTSCGRWSAFAEPAVVTAPAARMHRAVCNARMTISNCTAWVQMARRLSSVSV
jgi:hypothetical protein